MGYYMGDIHGNPLPAVSARRQMKMTEEDTLVLMGNVGANYYGNARDHIQRSRLQSWDH